MPQKPACASWYDEVVFRVLVVLCLAVMVVGCGNPRQETKADQATALRAAREFYDTFFNGHQRGEMTTTGWQQLRAVTTRAVYARLRSEYANLRRAGHGVGGPRCSIRTLTLRQDGDSAVAPVVALCGGRAVGHGVGLARVSGDWKVSNLRDLRNAEERRAAAQFAG